MGGKGVLGGRIIFSELATRHTLRLGGTKTSDNSQAWGTSFLALRCGCDKLRAHKEIGCKVNPIHLCNIPIVGGFWRDISVLNWAKYWWRAQVKTNRLKICHWVIDISSKSSAWGQIPIWGSLHICATGWTYIIASSIHLFNISLDLDEKLVTHSKMRL